MPCTSSHVDEMAVALRDPPAHDSFIFLTFFLPSSPFLLRSLRRPLPPSGPYHARVGEARCPAPGPCDNARGRFVTMSGPGVAASHRRRDRGGAQGTKKREIRGSEDKRGGYPRARVRFTRATGPVSSSFSHLPTSPAHPSAHPHLAAPESSHDVYPHSRFSMFRALTLRPRPRP